MRKLLLGDLAPPGRRQRGDLLLAAASFVRSSDEARLRGPMAGSPSAFVPPASLLEIRDACRRVQVRAAVPPRARSALVLDSHAARGPGTNKRSARYHVY